MITIKAVHFCVIPKSNNNAGDNLLYELIRYIINQNVKKFKIKWELRSQWEVSNAEEINRLGADFVLFGGGGLFLPDQKGACQSNNTGWQINIPPNEYPKIMPNIYGAAIGFNWFRKCKISKSIIKNSAKSFIKNSEIVGIRNYGSIQELNKILGNDIKMYWLPCATTLISKLCENNIEIEIKKDLKNLILAKDNSESPHLNIGINLSCDRLEQRGINETDFKKLIKTIKSLREKGHKITYVAHKDLDLKACEIIGNDLFDAVINISNLNSNDLYKSYLDFNMFFGGRGHSLMIPFGLQIPIISLTTHEKQVFFLKDANLDKFSIELSSLDSEKILNKVNWCLKNIDLQKLINNYQEKGLLAWMNFVKIIEKDIVGKYGI